MPVSINIYFPSVETNQQNIGISEQNSTNLSPSLSTTVAFNERNDNNIFEKDSKKKTKSFFNGFILWKYKMHGLIFLSGFMIGYNASFLWNFVKKILFKDSFYSWISRYIFGSKIDIIK